MTLKPLRQMCEPREDVVKGGLSDNHFAAQLDKIIRDPLNYPVYGDPEQFFALTYPTTGLTTLLTKAFGRVQGVGGGGGENGVLRSETSFGGGKTHGLTAVYHLARGARPGNVGDFLDPKLLPEGPVQIAAIVGDALDPSAGLETNGVTTFTIWGEMAAQIGPGASAVMAANDAQRTAPSTHTMVRSFGGQPTIVIIDEIAQHLRQALKSGSEDVRRYAQSVPVFLKNLFEIAGDPTNRVVAIVTLASGTDTFGKETNEIADLLDETSESARVAVAEAADVLTRMVQPGAVIKPAEDTEIGEILKRRLFVHIDSAAAADAARAYRGLYETLAREGERFSGGAEAPATYAAQLEKAYPFHPELVRVLDKRLGAIPRFHRARGALKLLAEVVSGIYRDGDNCDVINVADIDYSDEPVLAHLTSNLGRPEFARVAEADLAGPASHAASVDAHVFGGKPPYATRVARTVFIHSLEMTVTAGAGRSEWLLGTIRPGESTTLLEKALTENERICWHLSSDGARWRFHVEPNVNAILEEEKGNVQHTRVATVLDDLLAKAFGNDGGATTVLFPTGPASLPDQADLRVAVVHHDQRTVLGLDADAPDQFLVDMLDTVGQSKSPRKFRNSIVFVLADTDQVGALRDRVRGLIAADVIAGDVARMSQFSADVRKKIEAYQKNARLEARVAITRCFKHVYFPTQDKAHGHLRHRELQAQQQGDTRSATAVVLTLLDDEGKIRKDKPSYDWLKAKAWPSSQASVTTEALANWFWIDHSSPIIRNLGLVRESILDGMRNDGWVYYDASNGRAYTSTSMAGLSVEFRPDAELMTVAEASGRGLLTRKPTAGDLKGIVTGSSVATGAQVRATLEEKCGGEPSKADVLDLLAAAVSQHNYDWLVITDSDPGMGVRALTPTQIREKGLDGLRIMTRQTADTSGVEIPSRKVERNKFQASGPSGVAVAQIADKVSDSGKALSGLSIQANADDQIGTGDIDLLIATLGMLQRYDITVSADLTAEFSGIDGALEFSGRGDRKDYQALNATLSKVLTAATAVAGTVRLDFAFADPVSIEGPEFTQLATVLKTLNVTTTIVIAEVAK
ncbi:DUF499 domain-containing protein [Kribbella steppae]|uniref:DUF499 domain-containing protein n=1 Tax=Kribbella steppae TaxID=2512223 RepID=UPI00130EAA40|nr:DUF499 domain-containing protein [Kribbella steppae]